MEDITIKLKYILELSQCNHKKEIMNEANLKRVHIYCKIKQLSGQVSGPLIEYYIMMKYGMSKIKPSLCQGDLQHNDINYELKISNGGKDNNQFNYVQLRSTTDESRLCIYVYIFTAYYISVDNIDTEGELFIFKMNKEDIKKIIVAFGGYAHGTKHKLGEITATELDNPENDKEYAIHPKYGDKCWKELLHFRVEDLNI
jgi:hypothetical protein